MSILFAPINLGNMRIENRFIHSATYEVMASETGEVSDKLVKRYQNLAKGEVGLIIPGYMYVHPLGRSYKFQTGIHNDEMIPGLKKLVETVHQEGGKIAFQLAHAGRQTTKAMIGQTPIGPSSRGRDPVNFVKPMEMTADQIQDVIQAFGVAAKRAVEAGADGIQLHAAHGYLINQFISPFFNQRKDEWGGSDANRFRFLKELISEVRNALPQGMPVLVKLNTHDYTPQEGVTPSLAVTYAGWLADLKIDGLEISCGSAVYSYMNMCRGDVPVKELVNSLPFWKKPLGKLMMKSMVGKYDLKEGYNLEAAKMIKPVLGEIPLFVVGGLRKVAQMTEALEQQYADCISMCRPFIREPFIVKKIKEGKTDSVACVSCNRCLAAVPSNMTVRCYNKGFPTP
ncbi:MAG: NADH:flavin oxidoreductase [Desulfobacterales bacterium]|uniref:NADH:flavin oxidoreductase n=1 Tax=Candidatus Desulfatibia vada TaxID=2841696 RepID=A0A8J6P8G4_9BACT|nr:NADH:flavin oxidoreductase [Candidatus Desulfatibia vada]